MLTGKTEACRYNTFYHQLHLLKRPMFKELRTASFDAWQAASVAVTGAVSGLGRSRQSSPVADRSGPKDTLW